MLGSGMPCWQPWERPLPAPGRQDDDASLLAEYPNDQMPARRFWPTADGRLSSDAMG